MVLLKVRRQELLIKLAGSARPEAMLPGGNDGGERGCRRRHGNAWSYGRACGTVFGGRRPRAAAALGRGGDETKRVVGFGVRAAPAAPAAAAAAGFLLGRDGGGRGGGGGHRGRQLGRGERIDRLGEPPLFIDDPPPLDGAERVVGDEPAPTHVPRPATSMPINASALRAPVLNDDRAGVPRSHTQ